MQGARRSTYKGEAVTVSWTKHTTQVGSLFTAFYSLGSTGDQPRNVNLPPFQTSETAVAHALQMAHLAIDQMSRVPVPVPALSEAHGRTQRRRT